MSKRCKSYTVIHTYNTYHIQPPKVQVIKFYDSRPLGRDFIHFMKKKINNTCTEYTIHTYTKYTQLISTIERVSIPNAEKPKFTIYTCYKYIIEQTQSDQYIDPYTIYIIIVSLAIIWPYKCSLPPNPDAIHIFAPLKRVRFIYQVIRTYVILPHYPNPRKFNVQMYTKKYNIYTLSQKITHGVYFFSLDILYISVRRYQSRQKKYIYILYVRPIAGHCKLNIQRVV